MATAKGKFLREFNEAFVRGNIDFLMDNVTDNIRWEMVGDTVVEGKEAFHLALKEMPTDVKNHELAINNIITHGITAAVDGTITVTNETGEVKEYAFCDIYRWNKFKDGKIKDMRSYVVETPRTQ
ncbi:nuclear transport factor 2 family protein [Thalassobacillus pellis]|uniref:nuclear transport factor 2 family protein n=1 Tax=Thalassobacillus pellis TaxID=748008 RepID=UPI00196206A3|nr:nuclear transport factor 2 family protein [Thalassobacillus pellis]MBM7554274.1 ketosteroid isomerase-like protein [Thalassobacillus pellis]